MLLFLFVIYTQTSTHPQTTAMKIPNSNYCIHFSGFVGCIFESGFVFVPEVCDSLSLSHGLLPQTGNYLTLIFGLAGNQNNRQSLC